MNKNPIDPRLVALYNEYLEAGKEEEFIDMLYQLLDTVTPETRQKVYRARAAWKRKMGAPARKALKDRVEQFFAAMTPDELIAFQNTPWAEIPNWLKEALPKLVRNPETNNYVRIYDLVNKEQRQKEITGSRITRYMEGKRYVTSDEKGVHLHYDNFAKVLDEQAIGYDLPWTHGKRKQSVRVTKRDLKNYTECRVTPKGDKMALLVKTTGLPLWYLAGYMNDATPNVSDPLAGIDGSVKFHKARTKKGDAA